MKALILIFSAFFFFTTTSAFAHENEQDSAYERVIKSGVIRCGVMVWPPYFDIEPNTGEFKGLSAELFNELADLIDIRIEYKEIIVGQHVEELKRGKIDAVCGDGPYVFSAIKFVDYSHPAYYAPVFTYISSEDDRFKNTEDFNTPETRFVGIDGDISLDLALRNFPKASLISLPAITDVASLMMQVTTKKADVVILDPYAVLAFNAHNTPKLEEFPKNNPLAAYPVGFSVAKGEADLLNMLNAGIDALWNTNSALPILKKYDPTGKAFYPVRKPYEVFP